MAFVPLEPVAVLVVATATSVVSDPSHSHLTGSSGAGAPNGANLSGVGYGTTNSTGSATTGITVATTNTPLPWVTMSAN